MAERQSLTHELVDYHGREAWQAALHREPLLVITPSNVSGGTGSPANPIALLYRMSPHGITVT